MKMESAKSKNKRIFKNTVVLYIRMVVVMFLSLFTARIVLKALGVDDFGLFNVVGGVIGMMTFFKTTMAKTTQRFLNVSMVDGDRSLSDIFASSITVHLLFSLLFLLLCETLGLWFLNTHANIPEGRMLAANTVFQTIIISFCISIIETPYYAAVVSYERMSFVAVVSIIDAVARLGVSILLLYSSGDRLIYYGFLLLAINMLNLIMYILYCRKKYTILRFRLLFDKENFKQIFSFVSWTLIGQFAIVGCNQGNIVLVNMFHSLAANAAMSVGSQVNHAITNLTSNFQTAFNPQITKSYAEGNFDYLRSLVYTTSKISFCILFVVALPVSFNIDFILKLWLGEVPKYSNIFAILFLANGILNALSSSFNFTVLSSGNIRTYQLVISVIFLLDLPTAYFLFSLGMPPVTVLWVKVSVMAVICFVRIIFASRIVPSISVVSYLKAVLIPLFSSAAISIALAAYLSGIEDSMFAKTICTIIITVTFIVLVWMLCLTENERKQLLKYAKVKRK